MKKLMVAALVAMLACALAACSSWNAAHNHNAPTPAQDVRLHWVWLESPGSFDTIIFACHGNVGLYETQDSNLPFRAIANDSNCRS